MLVKLLILLVFGLWTYFARCFIDSVYEAAWRNDKIPYWVAFFYYYFYLIIAIVSWVSAFCLAVLAILRSPGLSVEINTIRSVCRNTSPNVSINSVAFYNYSKWLGTGAQLFGGSLMFASDDYSKVGGQIAFGGFVLEKFSELRKEQLESRRLRTHGILGHLD